MSLDQDYSKLTNEELSKKLQDLTKRIVYVERTNIQASTLPQMRHIGQMLALELRTRMEKRKLDMDNTLWPGDSKIVGEEDKDE